MGWQDENASFSVYQQVVEEGFILTQGNLEFRFEDSPFNIKPQYPSFQLLKVHRYYPIAISDGGKVSVRPWGDSRPTGDILRDKNSKLYDSVTFFLAPYGIRLPQDFSGRVLNVFEDGFLNLDGRRSQASLVYLEKAPLEVDGPNVLTTAIVINPQVPAFFYSWLYRAGKIQGYNEKAPFGKGWEDLGRFELKGIAGITRAVTEDLEKRFNTRILPDRLI
jgi:hypothetical protein